MAGVEVEEPGRTGGESGRRRLILDTAPDNSLGAGRAAVPGKTAHKTACGGLGGGGGVGLNKDGLMRR